jgi:hypothetical protein
VFEYAAAPPASGAGFLIAPGTADTLLNFATYAIPINVASCVVRAWVSVATLPDGPSTLALLKNGAVIGSTPIFNGGTGVALVTTPATFVIGDRIAVRLTNVGTGSIALSGIVYCSA